MHSTTQAHRHVAKTALVRFTPSPIVMAVHLALLAIGLQAGVTFAADKNTVNSSTANAEVRSVNVAAGPLGRALASFATARGILLSFDSSMTDGKSSTGLHGNYSLHSGFAELLKGSGLQLAIKADGNYTLQVSPDIVVGTSAATTLPTVNVTASAENAWGPAHGLVAHRSATATKTDTPLIETPQSIAVVTADQMTLMKAQTLEDALAYTAGLVTVAGYSSSFDQFTSRGFTIGDDSGSIYRDGLKLSGTSWASGQQEPYGLERVEFLKGASSVLYGASSPGGIVNTVTKRPNGETLREVNLEVGNLNHRQLAADLGGKLTQDGDWSWRLTALARDEDTGVDYIPNNSRYIAPALKWQPSAATSLTLLTHYQEKETAYRYPLPMVGTLLPSPFGKLPSDRFVGEPDFDEQKTTQYSLGYVFEHAFSDNVKLRHSARYLDSRATVRFTTVFDNSDPTAISRGAVTEYERTTGFSTDTSLEYKLQTGAVKHTILGGIDYSRYSPESIWYLSSVDDLNLYNPVYGSAIGPRSQLNSLSDKSVITRVGAYLQEQMKINDKWVVLLGGRQDWAKQRTSPYFGATNYESESDKAFTGRAGLVYLADNGLAPYFSYSESFEPKNGQNELGKRFKPTTGKQYEVGVRFQPKDSDLLLSASLYELTQQNVVTSDASVFPTLSRQVGEVRSRGLELEAKGKVTRNLSVIAAYAYTDAETTRSLVVDEVGNRTANVPRNQVSIWGDYNFAAYGLTGLRAGLGARYLSSTRDGSTNSPTIPGYTLFDALVVYEDGEWRYSLNIKNLTDKEYLNCSFGDCTYGEPRKVIAAVTKRW